MKKVIGVLSVVVLSACTSVGGVKYNTDAPAQTLVIDPNVQALSRQEVIQASKECQAGSMQPMIIYAKRRIGNAATSADIPVEVICTTRWDLMQRSYTKND
jgi:cellobiose-specific phosphotransferase system component IIB